MNPSAVDVVEVASASDKDNNNVVVPSPSPLSQSSSPKAEVEDKEEVEDEVSTQPAELLTPPDSNVTTTSSTKRSLRKRSGSLSSGSGNVEQPKPSSSRKQRKKTNQVSVEVVKPEAQEAQEDQQPPKDEQVNNEETIVKKESDPVAAKPVKRGNGKGTKKNEQATTAAMDTDELTNKSNMPQTFQDQVNVGLLIWAAQKSYPWWPGMLTYDPSSGILRKETKKAGTFTYHVQFFGTTTTRAWVHQKDIQLWKGLDSVAPQGKPLRKTLQSNFDDAMQQANKATGLIATERLIEYVGHFKLKIAQANGLKLATEHVPEDKNDDSKNTKSFIATTANEEKVKDGMEYIYEKVKDKNKPKRPMSAYLYFANETREKLYIEFPEKEKKDFKFFSGTAGARWAVFTDEQKIPYYIKYDADKIRYEKEMEGYVPLEPKKILVKKGGKLIEKKIKDPNKPKMPKSSYFCFMDHYREEKWITGSNQNLAEFTKQGGAMWMAMDADSKMIYEAEAAVEKGKYREAMLTYVPPEPITPTVDPVDTAQGDTPAVAPLPKPVAPVAPKQPHTACLLWTVDNKDKLKQGNDHLTMKDMAEAMSKMWANLSEVDRKLYTDKAQALLEEYSQDKSEYDLQMETFSAELKAYKAMQSKAAKRKAPNDSTEIDVEVAKKKRTAKEERVCAICEDGGELVQCNKSCKTAFHPYCIGLSVIPEDFTCDVCVTGNQRCFVCSETNGELHKCDVKSCGKHSHMACAQTLPRAKFNNSEKSGGFSCPSHTCANCDLMASATKRLIRCIRCPVVYHAACIPAAAQKKSHSRIICPRHFHDKKKPPSPTICILCGNGGELMCCDSCPNVYHNECVKDTVGFQTSADGDSWHCSDCVGGTKCMEGDIVWAKVGAHKWWPAKVINISECPESFAKSETKQGKRESEIPGAFPVFFLGSNEFWWASNRVVISWMNGDEKGRFAKGGGVQKPSFVAGVKEGVVEFEKRQAERKTILDDIKGKVKEKPKTFQRIRTNQYLCPKPAKLEVTECMCDETTGCQEDCLNRVMMIECDPLHCPAKSACCNQRMLKKQYPKLVEIKADLRGWGLRTQEDLSPGTLVIEYVGEIISKEMMTERLAVQSKEGYDAFYMLSIDGDHIIDARLKSNRARFANHSCDPNCYTQKWNVAGFWRVGIFAKKHIKEGDEITFDYQLDTLGNIKKKCECGAPNCSGQMGVKAKAVVEPPTGGKAKKKKKPKVNKIKEAEDYHESHCFQCHTDGDLLMCDYAKCPKVFCLKCLERTDVPRGQWVCPWHHCDIPDCNKTAKIFCQECPNSYCKPSHVYQNSKLELDPHAATPPKPFRCFGCRELAPDAVAVNPSSSPTPTQTPTPEDVTEANSVEVEDR